MTLHLMIDLETLGAGPDCVILQIAAVPFKEVGMLPAVDNFYIPSLSIAEQINLGRKLEDDTLRWWMSTDPEKLCVILNTKQCCFVDALADFENYIHKLDPAFIWSHGATFDIPILTHAFKQFGLRWPVGYDCFRDTRTLLWMKKVRSFRDLPYTNCDPHDALGDAIYQAYCVQHLLSM